MWKLKKSKPRNEREREKMLVKNSGGGHHNECYEGFAVKVEIYKTRKTFSYQASVRRTDSNSFRKHT